MLLVVVCLVEVGVVLQGFLFGDLGVPRAVHALVNNQVHFFEQKAVCWDAISLLQIDDIANNYIFDLNGHASSVGASLDGDLLVVNLVLELKELLLFFPVASCCNRRSKKNTTKDRERFDVVLRGVISEQGKHEVNHSCPDQKDYVLILELPAQQVLIGLDFGSRNEVLSENLSPSFKVMFVTDDATLHVCIEKSAQSSIIPALFQNVERDTAFSLIVRLLYILLLKKHLELLLGDSEYALLSHLWSFSIFAQEGLFNHFAEILHLSKK